MRMTHRFIRISSTPRAKRRGNVTAILKRKFSISERGRGHDALLMLISSTNITKLDTNYERFLRIQKWFSSEKQSNMLKSSLTFQTNSQSGFEPMYSQQSSPVTILQTSCGSTANSTSEMTSGQQRWQSFKQDSKRN